MWGIIIGILISLIVVVGIIVTLYFVFKNQKTQGIPVRSPIWLNFDSGRSGGYFLIVETKSYPSLQNPYQKYIEGKPLDILYDEEGKPIQPKIQNMSIKQSMIFPFASHTLSNNREIVIAICPPEDLHPTVRDSKFGLALSILYNMTIKEDMIIDQVKNRQKQIVDVTRELYSGELISDVINNIKNTLTESYTKRFEKEGIKLSPKEHNWQKQMNNE